MFSKNVAKQQTGKHVSQLINDLQERQTYSCTQQPQFQLQQPFNFHNEEQQQIQQQQLTNQQQQQQQQQQNCNNNLNNIMNNNNNNNNNMNNNNNNMNNNIMNNNNNNMNNNNNNNMNNNNNNMNNNNNNNMNNNNNIMNNNKNNNMNSNNNNINNNNINSYDRYIEQMEQRMQEQLMNQLGGYLLSEMKQIKGEWKDMITTQVNEGLTVHLDSSSRALQQKINNTLQRVQCIEASISECLYTYQQTLQTHLHLIKETFNNNISAVDYNLKQLVTEITHYKSNVQQELQFYRHQYCQTQQKNTDIINKIEENLKNVKNSIKKEMLQKKDQIATQSTTEISQQLEFQEKQQENQQKENQEKENQQKEKKTYKRKPGGRKTQIQIQREIEVKFEDNMIAQ